MHAKTPMHLSSFLVDIGGGARSVVELRGLCVQMWSRGLVRRTVFSRTAFAICRIQVPAPEVAEGEGNAGPRNRLHGN